MKTPREILLERHRAEEPKLDAVRENALASLSQRESRDAKPLPLRAALVFWRELILPNRRVWAGLAAVWVVIFALQASTGREPVMAAGKAAAPGNDAFMAMREQKQILAQLLDPAAPAPASRPTPPRPRGEVRRAVARA